MISILLLIAQIGSPKLIFIKMPEVIYTKRTADYDYVMGFDCDTKESSIITQLDSRKFTQECFGSPDGEKILVLTKESVNNKTPNMDDSAKQNQDLNDEIYAKLNQTLSLYEYIDEKYVKVGEFPSKRYFYDINWAAYGHYFYFKTAQTIMTNSVHNINAYGCYDFVPEQIEPLPIHQDSIIASGLEYYQMILAHDSKVEFFDIYDRSYEKSSFKLSSLVK